MVRVSRYAPRTVDRELEVLLPGVPAISIEGLKGIGKTVTAARRARTTYRLDESDQLEVVRADPGRLTSGEPPILVDEWQRLPESWDRIRRAVDDDPHPGRFLLTGSASVRPGQTHSGAGRIVTLRMRPMTLSERNVETPTVSLASILDGVRPDIGGRTAFGISDYVDEILSSGLPGLRGQSGRALRARLDGYLDRIIEADIPDAGGTIRAPETLRRWLRAYAGAVSTTTTFETIRAAATGGRGDAPARTTVQRYVDTLMRVWLIEPVPGWLPSGSHLGRLTAPERHQMADPALAARLVGATRESLLDGSRIEPAVPRDGTYLGGLFESLVCLEVRVAAQLAERRVWHLRTKAGEREVDLIVERSDGGIVAIEVKLARTIGDGDVRHLLWLRERVGDRLLDAAVISTGPEAYRREDGIAVIPAALLGP